MEKRYNERFGFECRDICDAYGFNLGNVFKYLYRCQDKGSTVSDLKKAITYIDFFLENPRHGDINIYKINSYKYINNVKMMISIKPEIEKRGEFDSLQIRAMLSVEGICSYILVRKTDDTIKSLNRLKNKINTLIELAKEDSILSLQNNK